MNMQVVRRVSAIALTGILVASTLGLVMNVVHHNQLIGDLEAAQSAGLLNVSAQVGLPPASTDAEIDAHADAVSESIASVVTIRNQLHDQEAQFWLLIGGVVVSGIALAVAVRFIITGRVPLSRRRLSV